MALAVNSIYTLTTLSVGGKGKGGDVPTSKPFPLPYKDNFDGENLNYKDSKTISTTLKVNAVKK